ncbi:Ubiquitin-like domain-containing protein [Fusarium sp. LHS14.1]|nr:Ubiquitin-like domain-containing protein [Fusarium sp. LHS14.1]
MPGQQWVFGVRVGESSVRQFRVLESGTWFSWMSLYGRREEESIEIQVTGFRRDRPNEYPNLPLAATKNPRGYTIFVISRSGKKIILEQMSSSDTVLNLKLRIREEEGTQVHRQRLIFNGKQLEDERTLSDYGILKGETVHMVMQLIGGGHSIMSALPHLSVIDNTEVSLKPEQLGPGGRIHQDFATDIEPEDWYETKTWTVRVYFFDADQFKSKTGLDLDPADNIERQYQVDGFVEDRFPSFREQAAVSVPSITQLYTQSKGKAQEDARNLDCAQKEEDAGQQGDTNEEVDPEQQMGTPRKQSRSKRFLSTLMCRSKW